MRVPQLSEYSIYSAPKGSTQPEESPASRPAGQVAMLVSMVTPLLAFLLTLQFLPTLSSQIHCYRPLPDPPPVILPSTSLEGCRPTLRAIRSFPSFSRPQIFLMHLSPRTPATPPFHMVSRQGDCLIEITCPAAELLPGSRGVEDRFSFSMVKQLAQDILQVCEESGLGGWASIGARGGWAVRVKGWRPEDEADVQGVKTGEVVGNGTISLEAQEGGNVTEV